MDTFHPYDLTSALQSAIETARREGEARYVIQTAWGYRVTKELGLVLYNAWKINADGGIADDYKDIGYGAGSKVYR
jgi:hypothetical protein